MPFVVKDLLSAPPVSLTTECTVAEALATILELAVGEIYITEVTGGLVGVVTDYELLKAQMTDTLDASVESVMCRCPAVASALEPVAAVASRFREARHARMAVVENGKFIGVISRHDIMRTMQSSVVLNEVASQVAVETGGARRAPRYMQPTGLTLAKMAAGT